MAHSTSTGAWQTRTCCAGACPARHSEQFASSRTPRLWSSPSACQWAACAAPESNSNSASNTAECARQRERTNWRKGRITRSELNFQPMAGGFHCQTAPPPCLFRPAGSCANSQCAITFAHACPFPLCRMRCRGGALHMREVLLHLPGRERSPPGGGRLLLLPGVPRSL